MVLADLYIIPNTSYETTNWNHHPLNILDTIQRSALLQIKEEVRTTCKEHSDKSFNNVVSKKD